MRWTASRSGNVAPSREVLRQDPRPRDLVLLGQGDGGVEVDFPLRRLAVGFDHDRELDQAGRRHRLVGVVGERLAGPEVLDGDRHLPPVGLDQGHQPRFERARRRRRGGRQQQADRADQDDRNLRGRHRILPLIDLTDSPCRDGRLSQVGGGSPNEISPRPDRNPAPMDLILASTSPYRKALIERLGVPFRCVDPGVDESTLKAELAGGPPRGLAEALALAKAAAVAAQDPAAVVIGGDQVVAFAGQILGKPGTDERAVAQLAAMAGRSHELITAMVGGRRGADLSAQPPWRRSTSRPLIPGGDPPVRRGRPPGRLRRELQAGSRGDRPVRPDRGGGPLGDHGRPADRADLDPDRTGVRDPVRRGGHSPRDEVLRGRPLVRSVGMPSG